MKWRIANNNQCNVCDQDEDYLHYFISNPYLKEFGWIFTTNFEKKINIENVVTVKHIIFGYKIFDQDYFDFNYYFNNFRIFYIQYKAYYVSEQKSKLRMKFFILKFLTKFKKKFK